MSDSFGFVITDPDNYAAAASRRPSLSEQAAINTYRERYKKAFFRAPEGIHVIVTVSDGDIAVFLPSE